jgi:hypothetical protein
MLLLMLVLLRLQDQTGNDRRPLWVILDGPQNLIHFSPWTSTLNLAPLQDYILAKVVLL